MVSAQESPAKRTMRRTNSKKTLTSGTTSSLTVTVFLLDGSKVSIHVKPGATVEDVCVGVRDQFGLESDADFSLFVREHGNFACLPDMTPAEDAEALGSADTRDLIYKRRLCLPHPKSVDEEAAHAPSPDQAAHRFLFIDATYNVVNSHYLVTPKVALRLAALHVLCDLGAFDPATSTREAVQARIGHDVEKYVSRQLLFQMRRSEVVAQVVAQYAALGARTLLDVQREYVDICSGLPEYGSSFFRVELARQSTEDEGDASVAPTPDWLDVLDRGEWAPVLVAINAAGVFMRTLPPIHGDVDLEEDVVDKDPEWWLNPIKNIEVWGVKKKRPIFTYRSREQTLTTYEMRTPQYQEMASVLHMYVFQLLAQREGKVIESARRSSVEGTEEAARAAVAAVEAANRNRAASGAAALKPLPKEWSEIKDPITGGVCWWNSVTRVTVWTRPDPDVVSQ